MEPIRREDLTPMMQHYMSIKDAYPDCIVMYRLGDFYEMFFEDAERAARLLELTLTSRECGASNRAPMCGVPHHVIETYISRLVEAGQKVALVDQMEDPALAKGLVKRSVTRIVTPGTLTDAESLDRKTNNFLLSVFPYGKSFGLCYTDITTGEIRAAEERDATDLIRAVNDWVTTLAPSEILFIGEERPERWQAFEKRGMYLTYLSPVVTDEESARQLLGEYLPSRALRVLKSKPFAAIACASAFDYIYSFQEERLVHLNDIEWVEREKSLGLNAATRENLEIHQNLEDRTKRYSLLWAMDDTVTSMGSRLLNQWLELPLRDRKKLEERHDAVEAFVGSLAARYRVRELLGSVYDLERLLSKLAYNRGNARDLLSLASSLSPIPELRKTLEEMGVGAISDIAAGLNPLTELRERIERAIREDAPVTTTEGGLIREGYDEELDALRNGTESAKEALLQYEAEQRERTGIKNLRVSYRRNVGYFIEITNSYLSKVPEDYRRRQTMKNAERFVTDFLEMQAARITGNEQEINDREFEIFQELRGEVAEHSLEIQQTAREVARLDVLAGFAEIADEYDYCRPKFTRSFAIQIEGGRHPVVERTSGEKFIENDTLIGDANDRIQILTGPNMAGKSTYMRQIALILIMAQTGSFVPAKSATLPIVDKVFTRIGASDNLARGDSTFMVEMKEMATILSQATEDSFLVLDEVGRGTSTDDGLSIAYAILEYLSDKLPAKTVFATHYHELTELAKHKKNIKNRKMEIREFNGKLLFMRKVVEGMADKSYGIEVARLSGLPQEVLDRASYILKNMDKFDDIVKTKEIAPNERQRDFSDFQKDALIAELAGTDINRLSPMDALNRLNDWIERAKRME